MTKFQTLFYSLILLILLSLTNQNWGDIKFSSQRYFWSAIFYQVKTRRCLNFEKGTYIHPCHLRSLSARCVVCPRFHPPRLHRGSCQNTVDCRFYPRFQYGWILKLQINRLVTAITFCNIAKTGPFKSNYDKIVNLFIESCLPIEKFRRRGYVC